MLATANLMAEAGWSVTVLACAEDDLARYTDLDTSTKAYIDPRVHVERVPFELGLAERDLREFSPLRAWAPTLWKRRESAKNRQVFPEKIYYSWRRPLERAAELVHLDRPAALVVVSVGPFVSFSAAELLANRYGVPYVVDHRDAWALQQFTGQRQHAPQSPQWEIESRVLTHADAVWFVNRPIKEWYESELPEIRGKTRIVMNGFDKDVLHKPSPNATRSASTPIQFGFLGTLTPSVPLAEFLEGWVSFVARQGDLDVRARFFGYLGFYSAPNSPIARLLASAADAGVSYDGPVPKNEVIDVYNQLDILLLIFGGDRYITSGKVFEYMSTGRPIVSVHGPENAARDVLKDYPLWFPVKSLHSEHIVAALSAAAEAVRSGASAGEAWRLSYVHAQRYERSEQIRPAFAQIADSVLRHEA